MTDEHRDVSTSTAVNSGLEQLKKDLKFHLEISARAKSLEQTALQLGENDGTVILLSDIAKEYHKKAKEIFDNLYGQPSSSDKVESDKF